MPPAPFPDEKPFFLMRWGWSLDIARTLILQFSSEFQHVHLDNFFKVELIWFSTPRMYWGYFFLSVNVYKYRFLI